MNIIGGLFGRSPFGPLHEHMAKVEECVEKLAPTVEFFLEGNWEGVRHKTEVISRIEHEADEIKRSIRSSLSTSIFSSVERSEILSLLKTQDAVADRCEDVALRLAMRKTPFPPFLREGFRELIARVTETTSLVSEVTRNLHRLYDESGDRSRVQLILRQIDQVDVAEHLADELEDRLRADLFEREKEVDPVTVMILLEIFKQIGNIADAAENVGDGFRSWIETR